MPTGEDSPRELIFEETVLPVPGKGSVAVRGKISPGERVVLQGASGCGKTTLLRMAAGLTAPVSGRVRIGDKVITGLAPQLTGAGFVFQSGALFPNLDVMDNVIFGLRFKAETREWGSDLRRQRGREFLETVGLGALAGREVSSLSGGEKQRVALVRTLITEPDYVLMDEPLSSVDPSRREELQGWIVSTLERRPVPALIVTHDETEAARLGTRRVIWKEPQPCVEF